MQILLTSEYDSEVLLEDDISPAAIHNELTDRAIEIEVSIDEVCEWLATYQQSLVVAEDYGDTISIVKQDFDVLPQVFIECDSIYDTDDLYNQVVLYPDEVSEIDMDIGDYPYDNFETHADKYGTSYERLRRWVESHPIQWRKLTLAEIADASKVNIGTVHAKLCECVISAKYVDTEQAFKQKRKQSRKLLRSQSDKPDKRRKQSLAKLQDWLRQNYTRWQSKTLQEIGDESGVSFATVDNNLAKLLFAEGFISNMSEYKQLRKDCRGYKGQVNRPPQYIVDII